MKILLLVGILVAVSGFEDKSITQYLADNGYTTLSAALQQTGLDAALAGSGPFTIFAPTDAAFQKVDTSGLSSQQLTSVLLYHVINEFVLVPMISQPTTKTTLNNQTLNIMSSGGILVLNSGSSSEARTSANGDIIVNNGVVQPIDNVLIPPILPTTVPPPTTTTAPVRSNLSMYQTLLRDDTRFQDLSIALILAGVVSDLEAIEFTLFAPVDSAFAVYQDNLLNPSSPNAQAIYTAVMKYHMVVGGRLSSQLKNGQTLYTQHNFLPLNVSVSAGRVMVNNANVIDADILPNKGVIHAIDKLLIPPDINQIASGRK